MEVDQVQIPTAAARRLLFKDEMCDLLSDLAVGVTFLRGERVRSQQERDNLSAKVSDLDRQISRAQGFKPTC